MRLQSIVRGMDTTRAQNHSAAALVAGVHVLSVGAAYSPSAPARTSPAYSPSASQIWSMLMTRITLFSNCVGVRSVESEWREARAWRRGGGAGERGGGAQWGSVRESVAAARSAWGSFPRVRRCGTKHIRVWPRRDGGSARGVRLCRCETLPRNAAATERLRAVGGGGPAVVEALCDAAETCGSTLSVPTP